MEVEAIRKSIAARREVYETKHAQADPLAEDCYNRWEALKYVIEAIELIEEECGLRDPDDGA